MMMDSRSKISSGRGQFRSRPVVATVLPVVALLIAVLLVWAWWGVRTVRQTLVAETDRDARALLESVMMASQYSITTASLVDQLEQQARLSQARTLAAAIAAHSPRLADLAGLASPADADGMTVWTGRHSQLSYPPELASVLASDSSVSRVISEGMEEESSLSASDTVSQARWIGAGVPTLWGGIILWDRASETTPRPALGGIGELIQEIGQKTSISYILLQSPDGIVFASRPLKPVLKLAADSFLVTTLEAESTATRELDFEGTHVLEAAAPFLSPDLPAGVLRVGMSLSAVAAAQSRLALQFGVSASLLLLLCGAFFAVLLTRRSLADLGRTYHRVETLTGHVLDSIDQAVVAVDKDGRVTILNPAAERLLGYDATASTEQPWERSPDNPDFQLSRVSEGGTPVRDQEVRAKTPSGMRDLVYTTTPVVAADGSGEGAVSIIRDETDARALAEQVRRSERLSEMGHLAAAVAHEVRNPLNAIALAAQRLQREVKDAGAVRLAGTLWDESKRLNTIVDDFLSLARPSTQPKTPVDLAAVVQSIIEMARLEAEKAGMELTSDLSGPHPMRGVADELRKAVWNIIVNALVATPTGGRVRVSLQRDHDRSRLQVSDTGPGITPDDLPSVFQPWFTTKSHGTGLGLAITHRIVIEHGGTIDILSPPPGEANGTLVTISLPLELTTQDTGQDAQSP